MTVALRDGTSDPGGLELERNHHFQELIVEVSEASEVDHQLIFATSQIAPALERVDVDERIDPRRLHRADRVDGLLVQVLRGIGGEGRVLAGQEGVDLAGDLQALSRGSLTPFAGVSRPFGGGSLRGPKAPLDPRRVKLRAERQRSPVILSPRRAR